MALDEDVDLPSFDRDPDAPTEPKRFSVDGDVFEAAPVLPAGATRDLASVARADSNQQVVLFGTFLDAVLLPESAVRFAQRLRDPLNPITDKQVGAIINHLVQVYAQRPTAPVSPSPNGAPTGGTN